MAKTLCIYFPQGKEALAKELANLAEREDRSVNHMAVRAIEEFVKRESGKKG